MSIGNLLEFLSQGILVGRILVGRLGVSHVGMAVASRHSMGQQSKEGLDQDMGHRHGHGISRHAEYSSNRKVEAIM